MKNDSDLHVSRPSAKYDAALQEMQSKSADPSKALALLRDAHLEGDYRAVYALSTWYRDGQESLVAQDQKMGLQLLIEAAKANIPEALFDLAVATETGEDVEKSDASALSLYLRAALRGHSQSVYEVGRCYFYGLCTPADTGISEIWFARALELGINDDEEL